MLSSCLQKGLPQSHVAADVPLQSSDLAIAHGEDNVYLPSTPSALYVKDIIIVLAVHCWPVLLSIWLAVAIAVGYTVALTQTESLVQAWSNYMAAGVASH